LARESSPSSGRPYCIIGRGEAEIGTIWVQEDGHPAYGPDLASCDFLLFGQMKESLKGKSFAEDDELLLTLSELINKLPLDMIV
jgi:hypothetical protein